MMNKFIVTLYCKIDYYVIVEHNLTFVPISVSVVPCVHRQPHLQWVTSLQNPIKEAQLWKNSAEQQYSKKIG